MKKILFILLTLFTLNSFTINAQLSNTKLINFKKKCGIITALLDLLLCRTSEYEEEFESDELVRFNDPEDLSMKFVGFKSSYNTCYANVSLQLLINAPGFGHFLYDQNSSLAKKTYILSELKKLYDAYFCDFPYCPDSTRLNVIRGVITCNKAIKRSLPKDQDIKFGKSSTPDIFLKLLFKTLIYSSNSDSLIDIFRFFNIAISNGEEDADAVILHVNGNHFVIKIKVRDSWTLIDEIDVIPNITLEFINKKYSNIIIFLSVKYL